MQDQHWTRHWLIRLATQVYHSVMDKFTAPNGREVAKVVTPSGVTGYIDMSIPMDTLIAIRDTMLKRLGLTLEEYRSMYGADQSHEAPPSR